jgi:hypothetical protein
MWRSVVFCTSLLIAAAVAADDTVERDSATRVAEAKEQAAGERDAKNERKAEQEHASANAESKQQGKDGDVEMSGMSILGNDEAPKSLVIVPWKTSQLGDMPGLSKLLDDATQPVDKDVFMRELAYYEIRTNSK